MVPWLDDSCERGAARRILHPFEIRHPQPDCKSPCAFRKTSLLTLPFQDSMFYRWKLNGRDLGKCYIWAVVPERSTLEKGGKSYYSEGDVTEIEIWNVTTSVHKPTSFSWNTRPLRQNLLGTVNFTTQPIPNIRTDGYDGKELKAPTPRLPCAGETTIMLEIACKSCKLEFDQVFSDPALGAFINHFSIIFGAYSRFDRL